MKKADVLQLTIVLVGIVYGFVALQYLFSSLYGIFAWIFAGGYGTDSYFPGSISIFAVIGLQVICCWLLITRSDKLAAYFYSRSRLGTGFKIVSKPNDLLYILLIAIGIYLFLSNIGPLLSGIFESFKYRSPRGVRGLFDDPRPVEWARLILSLIVPLVLLMFAKPIADYFAKNVGEEPISMEADHEDHKPAETYED
jgi:hypothetical protein